jgi:hypothetical protein
VKEFINPPYYLLLDPVLNSAFVDVVLLTISRSSYPLDGQMYSGKTLAPVGYPDISIIESPFNLALLHEVPVIRQD